MLILTRNRGQQIFINDDIKIKILSVTSHGQVRLGIEAPQDYAVHREEIYILQKNKDALHTETQTQEQTEAK